MQFEGEFTRVIINASFTPPYVGSKDQFGRTLRPEVLTARQDFARQAVPGAEFTHSSYPGSRFKVNEDGSLFEMNSGRGMGNIQDIANFLDPRSDRTVTFN